MTILTEPIGSIPRPLALINAIAAFGDESPLCEQLYEEAVQDTIERFEATGSPVVTDGEQRKYHNFWTYPVNGLPIPPPTDSRSRSRQDTLAVCFASRPGPFVINGWPIAIWRTRCITRMYQSSRQ